MTTLPVLRNRIIDDLARADLSSQITDAINSAITHYQEKRFFFNETRLSTFDTVAGQSLYTVTDNVDIPKWIEIDAVELGDAGVVFDVIPDSASNIEYLLGATAASNRPRLYSYFEDSFRLYPMPDGVYTVRPIGLLMKDAPAEDEAGNVWMTKAFELIRCRAKAYLCAHVTMDLEMAGVMITAEQDALRRLRNMTSKKQSARSGRIQSTSF